MASLNIGLTFSVPFVFATKNQFVLEAQIKELQSQLSALAEKFEKATGRKARTSKRVSIPVTDEEFAMIDEMAFRTKKSKAQFLRKVLVEKGLPALT